MIEDSFSEAHAGGVHKMEERRIVLQVRREVDGHSSMWAEGIDGFGGPRE